MSGLLNKAKDAVHKATAPKDAHGNTTSDNYGPHSSNLANKADPRFDSDLDNRNNPNSTFGNTSSGGAYSSGPTHTAGPTGTHTHAGSTNAGPHNSNLMNKADPRVDSDRDHRNDPSSTYGRSGVAGGEYTSTTTSGSTNAGPHNSNLLNKVDPRVDSDRDHRNDPTSTYGRSGVAGGEYTSTTQSGSTNAGPHNSNLMNKMDPRVDSDYDNRNDPTSRVGGYGGQDGAYNARDTNPLPSSGGAYNTHQTTGAPAYGNTHQAGAGGYADNTSQGYGAPTHHGAPGQHNLGTGAAGQGYDSSYTPGSGNAEKTAGPHNSNLLNKLDPRVDSDVDGSKTYGGNKTHY